MSSENGSSGVLSRLIENWLTKTPERGFEVPFAQVLNSKGHRIVHIDSHSPTEQGKDIITVDPRRRPCGYQLKQGNVTGSRWDKEIMSELHQLVELPVWLPALKDKLVHPHLVVTGTLNETAQLRLRQFNVGLRQRGFREVELIDRHVLMNWFEAAFGRFSPLEPESTNQLLEHYLSDGRENLNKRRFFEMISNFPEFQTREKGKIRGHISGLPIISAYAVTPAASLENHWTQFEAWVLTAARIAFVANKYAVAENDWRPSFTLCRDTACSLLQSLAEEAMTSEHLISGSGIGDGGDIWRTRATVLTGVVAAVRLLARIQGTDQGEDEQRALSFIEGHMRHLVVWGESAAPFFWLVYWFLKNRRTADAENLLAAYISRVCSANGHGRSAELAPPHDEVSTCLARWYSVEAREELTFTTFKGAAYTASPMVFELARSLRRQLLNTIWGPVSEVSHVRFDAPSKEDFLLYHSDSGTHRTEFFPRPTSWRWLRTGGRVQRRRAASNLPHLLVNDPVYAILFAIVHPHRLDYNLTAWLGRILS